MSLTLNYQVKNIYENITAQEDFPSSKAEEWEDENKKDSTFSSVKKYFLLLNKVPLLSSAEEIELARLYKQGRPGKNHRPSLKESKISEDAKNKLILCNLRLVVSLAKRYAGTRYEISELIQDGNLGLIRAVEKFDPEMGYRFSTYATWWIKQSILSGITEKSRLIRFPASISELLAKMKKGREILPKLLGREPTVSEICRAIEIPEKKMSTLSYLEDNLEQLTSLDSILLNEEGSESTLLETIYDDTDKSPEERAEIIMTHEMLENAIIKFLNQREQMVIRYRYGFNNEQETLTLTELGRMFNVSLERVRQIETKALSKLRSYVSTQKSPEVQFVY